MRIARKLAVTALTVTAAMGTFASAASASSTEAASPAAHSVSSPTVHTLAKVTGSSKCFNWSYDNGGKASVTIYYHNKCAHHKCLEIHFKHKIDKTTKKHIYAKGKYHGKAKYVGANPDISRVLEVGATKCH